MADDFDPEDYEGIQEKVVTLKRADVRRMEKAARERDAAQQELETLRRERLFLKAGIPDTPLGSLFIKGYDGPTEDADAIRKAAIEMGVLQPSAADQEEINRSLAGHAAASAAGSGAQPPGTEDFSARLRQAKSSKEIAQLMNQHLADNNLTTEQLLRAQHT